MIFVRAVSLTGFSWEHSLAVTMQWGGGKFKDFKDVATMDPFRE